MRKVGGMVENGCVRPEEPLGVPDGTKVEILIPGGSRPAPERTEEAIARMKEGFPLGGAPPHRREDLHDRQGIR